MRWTKEHLNSSNKSSRWSMTTMAGSVFTLWKSRSKMHWTSPWEVQGWLIVRRAPDSALTCLRLPRVLLQTLIWRAWSRKWMLNGQKIKMRKPRKRSWTICSSKLLGKTSWCNRSCPVRRRRERTVASEDRRPRPSTRAFRLSKSWNRRPLASVSAHRSSTKEIKSLPSPRWTLWFLSQLKILNKTVDCQSAL